MESYNAILIEQGISQEERIQVLRTYAIKQLNTLSKLSVEIIKSLEQK